LFGISIAWILRARGRPQMSAAPPRRNPNIAKGQAGPRAFSEGRPSGAARPRDGAGAPVRAAILAGGLLGALLLVVAEFTTLFEVHVQTSPVPIKSVGTGSHHSYALIPIAVVVTVFAVAVLREGSRPALLAIGLLGVGALVLALVGDLPDARASGLVGTSVTHYVDANSTPSAGLYLETLGAVVLIITSGAGFLMLGSPTARRRSVSAY
jgi:hypothetical protein